MEPTFVGVVGEKVAEAPASTAFPMVIKPSKAPSRAIVCVGDGGDPLPLTRGSVASRGEPHVRTAPQA